MTGTIKLITILLLISNQTWRRWRQLQTMYRDSFQTTGYCARRTRNHSKKLDWALSQPQDKSDFMIRIGLQFDNFLFAVSIFLATALRQSGLQEVKDQLCVIFLASVVAFLVVWRGFAASEELNTKFLFCCGNFKVTPISTPTNLIFFSNLYGKSDIELFHNCHHIQRSLWISVFKILLNLFEVVYLKLSLHYITLFSKVLSVFAYCLIKHCLFFMIFL